MRNRRLLLVGIIALIAMVLAVPTRGQYGGVMPGPGWQVVKAEWGAGSRWADVTNQVRMLLSGNGTYRRGLARIRGMGIADCAGVLRAKPKDKRRNAANARDCETTEVWPYK